MTDAAPSRLRTLLGAVLLIAAYALRIALRVIWDTDEQPEPPYVPPYMGVSVDGLPAGTCLEEPYPAGLVKPVPCTDPHRSEIVALLTYPAPPGAPYPGPLERLQQTLDPCRRAFEAYAGRTADQADARVFVVAPPSWEWAGGERTFICYAEAGDGAPRSVSLSRHP